MQNDTLTRLTSGVFGAELAQTWQILKHEAVLRKDKPKVRFKSETLPAFYSEQMTQLYSSSGFGWVVNSGLSGLFGNKGTMPRVMFKQVLHAHQFLSDSAPIDFFNSFNNRYFRLYCEVEQKHSVVAQIEEENFDWNSHKLPITSMLASLYGASQDHSILAKSQLIQYCGVIGMKLCCPVALKDILQDYFLTQFEVESSGIEYRSMTNCSLTRIGFNGQNQQLGMGALIGKQAALVGQKLNIKICPSSYIHCLRIRQDRNLVQAIGNIVRVYMGIDVKYSLYMKTSSQYLPKVQLTKQVLTAAKLGQTAWMGNKKQQEHFVEVPLSDK